MLLALAVIALAAAGVAIAYFLTHRDNGTTVTTVVTTSGTAAVRQAMPKLTGLTLRSRRTATLRRSAFSRRHPAGEQAPAGDGSRTGARGRHEAHPGHAGHAPRRAGRAASTTTATEATTTAATTTATAPPPPRDRDRAGRLEHERGRRRAVAEPRRNPREPRLHPGQRSARHGRGQAKQAGTTVPYHSHMQINVSSGPGDKPQEPVPNVIGQTAPSRRSRRSTARTCACSTSSSRSRSRSQAGKIVQQSPLAGAQAPRNAQVVVTWARSRAELPRQNARYQPRRSSSSLGSSDCVEMPTIASPRPVETRATTSASR